MNRLLVILAATAAVGTIAASLLVLGARAGGSSQTYTLQPGDIVRVGGNAEIGCKVRPHDGAVTLDCRRAGPLAGTYAAMLNKNEVLVARFKSAKVAKVVFVARHHRARVRRCT